MLSKLRYARVYIPILCVLWVGLWVDSRFVAGYWSANQWLTNAIVLICFVWVYLQATQKIKKLMLYGVALALLGELVFSLVFGMYEYRLENVPIYVPLGHSLVYAAVFYICKERVLIRHRALVCRVLYCAMLLYATGWLLVEKDFFGFLCTLFVVFFLRRRRVDSLFFLVMYFMVVYLELLGTHYECWFWPDTWFATVPFVPSANPPSGISAFYFGFDLGCLWIYKQLNRKAWHKMKAISAHRYAKSALPSAENH